MWTYRNFTAVNDLAKRHHVAFILLLHTRKQHDTDNPFDDILGSTANQAACSHMIVLFKERGEQLINIALGGSLYQDLPAQMPSNVKHRQEVTPARPE